MRAVPAAELPMVLAFQRERFLAVFACANLKADSARHVNKDRCEQHTEGVVKGDYASRRFSQLHAQWKRHYLLGLIQELQSSLRATQG
jgi:hypothetical protein